MIPQFAVVDSLAREIFAGTPVWRFFVPGRLEVFGKHTDYAGGRSLVAAVPRGFAVAALPAADGRVVVVDAVSGDRFEYALGGTPEETNGWRRYVATVIRRLSANFPDADVSARVIFASDLPQASGISSSSALVISIAEALIARSGIDRTDLWMSVVRTDEERASYFACLENGAPFGALAGDEGVGVHGGSEDHAAILTSAAGELRQFSFSPLRLDRVVPMPEGWTFVVVSSGVSSRKGAEARKDYNRLAASAAAIVSAWRSRHPDDPRTLGELAREERELDLHLPRDLRDRLEHFTAEDARVAEASDALARADIARIGQLADQSQRDAERLLGNQVPETIDLVALARGAGAAAASAFGAGWGGSVWALAPSVDAAPLLERWLGAYRARYPHRVSEGFISAPGDGVRRIG